MANIGTIEQYQGPFLAGSTNNNIILNGQCIIGISVSEDDFMLAGSTTGDSGIECQITSYTPSDTVVSNIRIGRTFIYQTQQQYAINKITFPAGAPESTLVNIVYCLERS